MPWFGDDHEVSQKYNEYQEKPKHEAHLSHELLSGAAAFAAAKSYEEHCAKNGKPQNHALAKELAAGFAGAFIDKQIETHGLDFIDKQKAKRQAKERCEEAITVDNY